MTVSPTGEKILKTVEACKRLQNMTKPLISEVAEVIGLIVSNFPGAFTLLLPGEGQNPRSDHA